MLALKREDEVAAAEPQTVIGKGAALDGKLTSDGAVRVEGHFRGRIETRGAVVVSAGAKLEADIVAASVVVFGELSGNVVASGHVELHPPARVKGSLETPALVIDKGANFDGTCKMDSRGEAPVKKAG
jgi:cytoskeletal protein CcmA (bactofilin family)